MVLLTMPSVWDVDAMPMVSHDPKIHVALHFNHLDLRSAIVPLTMLFASLDADASAIGFIWPRRSCCTSLLSSWPKNYSGAIYDAVSIMWYWHWCQWYHEMSMSMAVVSPDQTSHVVPHFDYLDVRNAVVPLTVPVASCDAISANGITWPERSYCSSFQSFWPNKCNGAIDNAMSIPCCLCQC